MKKFLAFFAMLFFVSTIAFTQTVNFESYQNLKVSPVIEQKFQNSNVTMNFDEAYLSISKDYDKFNFGGTVVLDGSYSLNLHSAYLNYTDNLFTDVTYKVTAGKFINDWFNHTYDKNYTFTKNLIVNYPEFSLNGYNDALKNNFIYTITDPGVQVDVMDMNGGKVNVALFDVKNGMKNLFSTLSYGNENLKGGIFFAKLIGDSSNSKPMVFGGDLKYYTQINKNPIAGGIEAMYYKSETDSAKYVASVWGQFGLKSLSKWGLYTKWEIFVPNSKIDQNNTKGSLFVIYTPNEVLNLGLGYTYNWINVNTGTWQYKDIPCRYYSEISLKTGFIF